MQGITPQPTAVYCYDEMAGQTVGLMIMPIYCNGILKLCVLPVWVNTDEKDLTATNQNGHPETRRVNLDDQYTQINDDTTIAYDPNGNLIAYGNKTYRYDYANRLIEVSENQHTLASYTYDAEHRRISKTVDNKTTIYLYHENQVIHKF